MNEELSKKLFERFDFFYPETPVTESLMAFGFECDDGWFQIIWDLCEEIEKQLQLQDIDQKQLVINKLKEKKEFRVVQVKEKFGSLRFYVESSKKISTDMYEAITKAEAKSAITCESCGSKGQLMSRNGWYKTLCTSCGSKTKYKPTKEQ